MILQIDAGNTRIHWRLVGIDGERTPIVRKRGHVEHGMVPEPVGREVISGVELACVAGEDVCGALHQALDGTAAFPVVEARTQDLACGVTNSYADAGSMGVDRWLAMIAAFNHHPGGVIVVDAGTAVTIDYVDSQGQHLGGYILPGMNLMSQALGKNTARVKGKSGNFGPPEPGSSTTDCVNHGIAWIWSSAAERLRQDQQARGLGAIVVTGGDADSMAQLIGSAAVTEPDLVFMGMDLVFADTAPRSELRG